MSTRSDTPDGRTHQGLKTAFFVAATTLVLVLSILAMCVFGSLLMQAQEKYPEALEGISLAAIILLLAGGGLAAGLLNEHLRATLHALGLVAFVGACPSLLLLVAPALGRIGATVALVAWGTGALLAIWQFLRAWRGAPPGWTGRGMLGFLSTCFVLCGVLLIWAVRVAGIMGLRIVFSGLP